MNVVKWHLICVHLVGHHVPHDVAVCLRVQGVGHHEVVGVVSLEVLHDERVGTVAPLQQPSPGHPH